VKQATFLEQDPHIRRDEDFYATARWMTQALLRRCPLTNLSLWNGRLVEPCCGDGAIVLALPSDLDVLTNDVVARGGMLPEFLLDATLPETWAAFARTGKLDAAVTNPPFNEALAIVQQAYSAVEIGVVMLLRLSWLEPTEDRGPWLQTHPPTRVIVMPRYDFRGDGKTDSVCAAWMLWAKRPYFCDPGIEVVTKGERDELIAQERQR
jgi:hypothetical protein